MNRRTAARSWSAPVLWRFDYGREQIDGQTFGPGVINTRDKSARGLAHSTTLARGRRFKGSKRGLSVEGKGSVRLSSRERPTLVAVLTVWFTILFLAGITQAANPLVWQQADGYRWADLPVLSGGKTGFARQHANATGLTFTNFLADARSITNRNLLSGAGVAAGDVDGDGRTDVYFCGLDSDNKLFRNLDGWKFTEITTEAGVACPGQDSTAAAFADIDGDGDLDLIVNSLGHGTRMFENDGKAHFKEITHTAGVASKSGSMSMALADIDGDGDLDLYVANFRPTTIMDQLTTTYQISYVNDRPVVTMVNGVPATAPEYTNRFVVAPSGNVLELAQPDVLYRNDGKGRFSPVSWTNGSFLDEDGKPLDDPPRDWGLHVQFHDLNGDGAPDIYVCNDLYTPDRIWINDGHGKFRALDRLALRCTSTFSMGADFADIDRDGFVDFFVVDMLSREHAKQLTQVPMSRPFVSPIGMFDNRPQMRRNTLQRNRGDGTFAELSYFAGVEASEWSWGPIFLDVDLDGYEDILVTNGQLRDFQNNDMNVHMERVRMSKQMVGAELLGLVKLFPNYATPNLIFRNRGNWTFEEVSAAWGFHEIGISQGMALADLDNDGDMDVVMNNLNEEAGVYRNEGGVPRVTVRLKGLPPNTRGIGAKIKVTGGPVVQSQEMICAGRYLSADDPLRVFAAGNPTNRLTLEVTWRSGKTSIVRDAQPNRIYELDEAQSAAGDHAARSTQHAARSAGPQPSTIDHQPFFEDVSHLLNHTHAEAPFDDFERQPLLPNRLSQLGPGVCWQDLDGDGRDDLIIGSGKGGRLAAYHNNASGGFVLMTNAPLARPAARDQTTVLAMGQMLLVGSSNYEDGLTNGGCIRIYDLRSGAVGDSILGQLSSTGPLALGDVDGDEQLDLFVGGRSVPGRYPEPAMSLLMRNQGGRLTAAQRFEKLGLVSGAVFSDLDGDGDLDLALACEWGPVKLFRNEAGKLQAWAPRLTWPSATSINRQPSTINHLTGWWNGLTTGDLDGDGRLDLIASNWGLNTRYRASQEHPRRLYYGDFDGNGIVDLVEACYDELLHKEVSDRWLMAVASAIPFVQEKTPTFEAFAKASVQEVLGESFKDAGVVEVNTLASMVFFNRGDHFEARELPPEAQLAPAFGLCVGDLDGDGNEDVFLSQNFFATTAETTRNDAGRGLWLRGDGKGGLTPVPGQESGVKVYGEQRGCALSDYDGDGRVDLAVTQNGNATKLYHNVGAKPGLRVRLKGPPGNTMGIGATMRLKFGERFGPAREVHAGAGYWSQDSAVHVLGTATTPTHLWVRWPGGKEAVAPLPPAAREVALNPEGKLEVLR